MNIITDIKKRNYNITKQTNKQLTFCKVDDNLYAKITINTEEQKEGKNSFFIARIEGNKGVNEFNFIIRYHNCNGYNIKEFIKILDFIDSL